ncbi:hypothetical protein F4813DRAFT_391320 [Daldinia decipiens]|uniref:uncharacterized protein n=1 Tax=Daldinia decipiens TaxID=326647 RepID=UPI0020C3D4B5|nr:uncharacterized protein F4813DRAFT_391320 [Daldinia decipiens]KAI1655745.1 hypothetical protein F4813DRAFT_391320 [Daldinia decipiens]
MQISALLSIVAFSAAALAQPLSMAANAAQWTITGLSRAVDAADTSSDWTFGIDNGAGVTAVKYTVKSAGGAPATRSNGGPVTVGDFTITSGWSGQFGDDKGFTTFSVVDNAKRQIVYPSYTDAQLKSGQVVTPDQSYPVQNLP